MCKTCSDVSLWLHSVFLGPFYPARLERATSEHIHTSSQHPQTDVVHTPILSVQNILGRIWGEENAE